MTKMRVLRNLARVCRASKVLETDTRDLRNLAQTCRALRLSEMRNLRNMERTLGVSKRSITKQGT